MVYAGVHGREWARNLVDGRLCRTVLRYPLLWLRVLDFGTWEFSGRGGILSAIALVQWLRVSQLCRDYFFVRLPRSLLLGRAEFRFRRGEQIYISQWYLLGAFLWFRGCTRWSANAFSSSSAGGVFASGCRCGTRIILLFLWFGAIGLGTAYYMIPKVIGRPVYSYHLAAIGFWSTLCSPSWTGMQRSSMDVPRLDGPCQ